MADEPKGDEGELQGNSEFLPFQKADNDDVPDTVEVVALDDIPSRLMALIAASGRAQRV